MGKKVFALIGSRNRESSNTRRFCELFVDGLREGLDVEFDAEILNSDSWNIGACLSCANCFRANECPQDASDGMSIIKEKILESDILILGSPVYLCHVSGDMKILIDRLAYWAHTMPLIGHGVVLLQTTSNNHPSSAIDYMEYAVTYMGAHVLGKYNAYVDRGDPLLDNVSAVKSLFPDAIQKANGIMNGVFPEPSELLRDCFDSYNRRYRALHDITEKNPWFVYPEERVWAERGYFRYATIEEAESGQYAQRANKAGTP